MYSWNFEGPTYINGNFIPHQNPISSQNEYSGSGAQAFHEFYDSIIDEVFPINDCNSPIPRGNPYMPKNYVQPEHEYPNDTWNSGPRSCFAQPVNNRSANYQRSQDFREDYDQYHFRNRLPKPQMNLFEHMMNEFVDHLEESNK